MDELGQSWPGWECSSLERVSLPFSTALKSAEILECAFESLWFCGEAPLCATRQDAIAETGFGARVAVPESRAIVLLTGVFWCILHRGEIHDAASQGEKGCCPAVRRT